ncbi:MAG: tagatose 1,6-diphosphate aldolase [Peptoniphilaceae bacterium]|nr:tagatose 1,6-diphosphate aldolase [Peptoniphilaceae bacterium]MDY3738620.1 tagatose 1,6-diphosphate aldolase [Peptoniphilaceae bacterium]
MKVSKEKFEHLKNLSNEDGVIAALAIDQRGSMEKMMAKEREDYNNVNDISRFKGFVSKELTQYASSILTDTIYGQKAISDRDKNAGLLLSYEITGYDNTEVGRLPRLIKDLSGLKIKELGSDAIKILLYYDVDEPDEINDLKKTFVERIGYEAEGLGLPFFLEIVSYDANVEDKKEYAKLRPRKVIEAVKVFSDERYKVDVLKLETPVDMHFVEGFSDGEFVYTKEEAKAFFKEQSESTNLPFIFLSGGVTNDLFKKTLVFAKESGSRFNGVLCGRATWKDCVKPFTKSDEDALNWLRETGKENITSLNEVLKQTAVSVFERIEEE